MTQQEICEKLSYFALKGLTVVRLKGGDPGVFGRAAEEVEHLSKNGIDFAIVPGITAASGCSAWSGILLTHRDCAHSVRFVTAHLKDDKTPVDWKNLAESNDTLVFYMGLNRIEQICNQLICHGKPFETPIALIDQGTTTAHTTVISSLASISKDRANIEIKGPALIVVGEAINHRADVNIALLSQQYNSKHHKQVA